MSDVSVTPPAANVWDVADIATQALAVLRMDSNDVDAARVSAMAAVVTVRLDKALDTDTPIDTSGEPPLVQAAVIKTVEEYRTKDAPWGVLDAWSADTVPVRISSDWLRSVRSLIIPYKARFSIG